MARRTSSEAEQTEEPYWRTNPFVHATLMAKIWSLRARVCESAGNRPGALVYAHRALDAAFDPEQKATIQQLIENLSSPPSREESCGIPDESLIVNRGGTDADSEEPRQG